MSTQRSRRQRVILPPWLTAPRRFRAARDKDGKPARVTVMLSAEQQAGLDRILASAKREHIQLSEGEIVRVAIDELLAAVDRYQSESSATPEPAPPPADTGSES